MDARPIGLPIPVDVDWNTGGIEGTIDMQMTWFITGSSRGFGREIAEAALKRGDRVVATARKPDQLDDLLKEYGDQVLTYALDVTDSAAANRAIDAAINFCSGGGDGAGEDARRDDRDPGVTVIEARPPPMRWMCSSRLSCVRVDARVVAEPSNVLEPSSRTWCLVGSRTGRSADWRRRRWPVPQRTVPSTSSVRTMPGSMRSTSGWPRRTRVPLEAVSSPPSDWRDRLEE